MIQIISHNQRVSFLLEDNRTVTEFAQAIRYELLNDTKEQIAFYRYGDGFVVVVTPIVNVELNGEALTPEMVNEKLGEFFEEADMSCCCEEIDLSGYVVNGENPAGTKIDSLGDLQISSVETLLLEGTEIQLQTPKLQITPSLLPRTKSLPMCWARPKTEKYLK